MVNTFFKSLLIMSVQIFIGTESPGGNLFSYSNSPSPVAWENIYSWSVTSHNDNNPPSGIPGTGDDVYISDGDIIQLTYNGNEINNLIIKNIRNLDTRLIIVDGELTINGNIYMSMDATNSNINLIVEGNGKLTVRNHVVMNLLYGNGNISVTINNNAEVIVERDVQFSGDAPQEIILHNTSKLIVKNDIKFFGDGANKSKIELDYLAQLKIGGNIYREHDKGTINSKGNSTIIFNGTQQQQIIPANELNGSGIDFIHYQNVVLNNTFPTAPQFILSEGDVTIDGTLAMQNGMVDLNNKNLYLGISGTQTGVLNRQSGWLYNGNFVRWMGTGSFNDQDARGLFPMGTSKNYRPLFLSTPTGAITSSGTVTVSHDSTGEHRSVNILDRDGVTLFRQINDPWNILTTGLEGGPFHLRVIGYGMQIILIRQLGHVRLTLADNLVGLKGLNDGIFNNETVLNPSVARKDLTRNDLNNAFFISYVPAPLPIAFYNLKIWEEQKHIKIYWATVKEQDVNSFTIQKYENESAIRQNTGSVISGISADGSTYYVFTDSEEIKRPAVYRIVHTDLDESVSKSPLMKVAFPEYEINSLKISITRRLENGYELLIENPEPGTLRMDLFDLSGMIVMSDEINMKNRESKYEIFFPGWLPAGLYMVRIYGRKVTKTIKLIKMAK